MAFRLAANTAARPSSIADRSVGPLPVQPDHQRRIGRDRARRAESRRPHLPADHARRPERFGASGPPWSAMRNDRALAGIIAASDASMPWSSAMRRTR
jgi:hypothetical protein